MKEEAFSRPCLLEADAYMMWLQCILNEKFAAPSAPTSSSCRPHAKANIFLGDDVASTATFCLAAQTKSKKVMMLNLHIYDSFGHLISSCNFLPNM